MFGFPFSLEGFAFFLEAIFVGIYLYGWDRMSPRAHMLDAALPIVVSGVAGAFFVIAANAWMNNPTGFRMATGAWSTPTRRGDVRPVHAAAVRAHASSPPTW